MKMSEQTEALNFGPQWIRDLSNGASVSVPPPSPGPSYKLAQFRYGKEEMLALFSNDLKPPKINQDVADFILNENARNPLAMMPLTEEEQRNSFGSLNSVAVLKMMGRGGQRGGRGMSRGGRGSGRGRGEPGFYRGFSQDETTSKSEDGWQRETSRKHSWGESTGRGGFGDRSTTRDPETSPRGYDPTASSGRHGRALASGNWRSSESGEGDDDGGGWVTPSSKGAERAERWKTSSREGWHHVDYSRGERGDGWNQGWNRSGSRDRSFEDVPEWSKSDNVFEPDLGSFDDTGAFCVAKDKKPPDDTGSRDSVENVIEAKEDWDLELADDNHDDESKCNDIAEESDTAQDKELERNNTTEKHNVKLKDPQANAKDIQQQANVKDTPAVDNSPTVEEKTAGIVTKQSAAGIAPVEEHKSHEEAVHQDEVGANLERVAESCIANLDVESEERAEERMPSSLESSVGKIPSSVEETLWFYRDPQGQEQGPFRNEEMAEWFHHGYFTMQLSVRRQCDNVYLTLGEVIKRWKRVPFLPGPSPPPFTVIGEQTMLMQQQLLQQHYQHLQKQVILQQIQQQQQLQKEQLQKATESALQLNFRATAPENRTSATIVSPRTHPTTTHSGTSVGAAEMIWGPEPQSPKGSWSPSVKPSPWEEGQRQTSPVPNVEELQRREREKAIELEKERQRLEAEKREAELLRLKEEEEKRLLAQKQEEERMKRELIQHQQRMLREQEEKRQEEERLKWQEEEKMKEELRKAKAQKEEEEKRKKAEAYKKRKAAEEENKKREMEQRAAEQARLKQQQRLLKEEEEKRQEEERMKRQDEERIKEEFRKYQESQQMKAQSNGSSRWGSQNAAAMSLSEIQEQEEKNRRAHEVKLRELEARQRQLQSVTSHGWSEKLQASGNINSFKAIQDEQARQPPKQSKQQHQPSPVSPSSAWTNSWTAGNNNVWAGNYNEREEQEEAGFWGDAMRAASAKTKESQPQAQPKASSTQPPKQVAAVKPVTNGKKSGKKTTKEEESVRKIFQQTASSDPFMEWCTQSLRGLATAVDIPTFIAFLKDLESPYEVHTYVREYIGESNEAKSFAKEFIERRRSSEWKHVPTKSSSTASTKQSTAGGVVARGGGGASRAEPENKEGSGGKNKKKKKQRMQKVDPSILGFSVNAAERVNMGEIQSVDES